MVKQKFADIDAYIASFPPSVQARLKTVRATIRKAVPQAEERITYHMPTFRFHGDLLFLAAYKRHYSLFGVTASTHAAFERELAPFKWSTRGTVQFPLDAPVPVDLITRIARQRARENLDAQR